MQSKQSKECSVFSYRKTWLNFDRPVSYQTKLSSELDHMRYDVIVINTTTIEQNRIQYMICHNITIIDIIEHNIYVTVVTIYIDFMSFQPTVKTWQAVEIMHKIHSVVIKYGKSITIYSK
jgi:hypothetical protein